MWTVLDTVVLSEECQHVLIRETVKLLYIVMAPNYSWQPNSNSSRVLIALHQFLQQSLYLKDF